MVKIEERERYIVNRKLNNIFTFWVLSIERSMSIRSEKKEKGVYISRYKYYYLSVFVYRILSIEWSTSIRSSEKKRKIYYIYPDININNIFTFRIYRILSIDGKGGSTHQIRSVSSRCRDFSLLRKKKEKKVEYSSQKRILNNSGPIRQTGDLDVCGR